MMKTRGYIKSVCFMFILYFLMFCGPKRDDGETRLFSLKKVLTVDTENDETAETGLTDIMHFDIDSVLWQPG